MVKKKKRKKENKIFSEIVLFQKREMFRSTMQNYKVAPEIEHLVNPKVFDMDQHTVTVTDVSEIDITGQDGLRLGVNKVRIVFWLFLLLRWNIINHIFFHLDFFFFFFFFNSLMVWYSMLSIVGNKIRNLSSILDEAVCILLLSNAHGKGMNSSVLSLAMGRADWIDLWETCIVVQISNSNQGYCAQVVIF